MPLFEWNLRICFPCFCNLGCPGILLKIHCGVNTEPSWKYARVYPQTLAEICRNIGICDIFRKVAARESISGFCRFVNKAVNRKPLPSLVYKELHSVDYSSTWRHQTITWINVDSLVQWQPSNSKGNSTRLSPPSITNVILKITYLKFTWNLPSANELMCLHGRHYRRSTCG